MRILVHVMYMGEMDAISKIKQGYEPNDSVVSVVYQLHPGLMRGSRALLFNVVATDHLALST